MPKKEVMLTQVIEKTNTHKAYQIVMDQNESGWFVSGFNGRIGSPLKEQPKLIGATEAEAEKAFDKLVKSKISGGYKADGESVKMAVSERETREDMVPMRPTAFDEQDIGDLDPRLWLVQEKHDGESRPVRATRDGAVGTNHRGQTAPMSEACVAQLMILADAVGDIVIDTEDLGDAGLMVFDVRSFGSISEKSDFRSRNDGISALKKASQKLGLNLIRFDVAVPLSDFIRERGPQALREQNAEGYVLKRSDAEYAPGRIDNPKKATSLKIKFYEDATFRIAPARSEDKRSVGLESWDPETGDWEPKGNVTIPPNVVVPEPLSYADVRYLYVVGPHGAPVQPTYLRSRPDVVPEECSINKLKLKRGTEPKPDEIAMDIGI